MRIVRESAWGPGSAFMFIVSVCLWNGMLSTLASFGTNYSISIRDLGIEENTRFLLLTTAILAPAIYCFLKYPETRRTIYKIKASALSYGLGVLLVAAPFIAYFGSSHREFPWGGEVVDHFIGVFAANFFWTPLWEETVWRGCLLRKIRTFWSVMWGIPVMAVGWTLWHLGYIAFLYSEGIPIEALRVLLLTYFCMGIILGSLFELAGGSLWPGVILHAGFNASTAVYFSSFHRVAELGSYLAESAGLSVLAGLLFTFVVRRSRSQDDPELIPRIFGTNLWTR